MLIFGCRLVGYGMRSTLPATKLPTSVYYGAPVVTGLLIAYESLSHLFGLSKSEEGELIMPDNTIAIIILLGSFAVMTMAKMPMTFSLAISSVVTALYLKVPLMSVFLLMVKGVNVFSLLAIPFL